MKQIILFFILTVTTFGQDLLLLLDDDKDIVTIDTIAPSAPTNIDAININTGGGGLSPILWERIEPFLREEETDFWKGLK